MENNIENLLADQKELKELAKKQTSIVDATVNILKRSTEEVNSHFSEIKKKIEYITATMNDATGMLYPKNMYFLVNTQEWN